MLALTAQSYDLSVSHLAVDTGDIVPETQRDVPISMVQSIGTADTETGLKIDGEKRQDTHSSKSLALLIVTGLTKPRPTRGCHDDLSLTIRPSGFGSLGQSPEAGALRWRKLNRPGNWSKRSVASLRTLRYACVVTHGGDCMG